MKVGANKYWQGRRKGEKERTALAAWHLSKGVAGKLGGSVRAFTLTLPLIHHS